MKRELLDRVYAFLNEVTPVTTKSTTGRVTQNMPAVSARGSSEASKHGKSANTMTRRALNVKPVAGIGE
jgi:hypothetical protein